MQKTIKRVLSLMLIISMCFAGSVFAEMLPYDETPELTSYEVADTELQNDTIVISDEAAEKSEELLENKEEEIQITQLEEIFQSEYSEIDVQEEADSTDVIIEDVTAEPATEVQTVFEDTEQIIMTEEQDPVISEGSVSADIDQSVPAEQMEEIQTEIDQFEVIEEITEIELDELNKAEDYSPLSYGMNSDAVRKLQRALHNKGYYVWPDGFFGRQTETAVKVFQMYNGLSVTGIADEIVQKAAQGDGVGYYEFGKGTNSLAVSSLQTLLRDLGYLTSVIDGDFGSLTELAVLDFQKKNGLTVDGSIGMQTLESMLNDPIASSGNVGLSTKKLSKGATGEAVKQLQRRLDQLGFLQSTVDGDYGSFTEKAVKEFQMYNNLPITGTADLITIAFLNSENAVKFYSLTSGSDGKAASGLQSMLQKLGYLSVSPDGIFGSVTRKALTIFQRTNGLYADGVAGPETLNKLFMNPVAYDPNADLQFSEVERMAMDVLDLVGWNLYSAFEWSVGMSYNLELDIGYTTSQTAIYSFKNYYGNCISMATTFYWMARLLGYNVRTIYGTVPYRNGSSGPHGWIEIDINGGTYVCDPDFERQTGNNGYMIYYGQSGTWKYQYGYILSDY